MHRTAFRIIVLTALAFVLGACAREPTRAYVGYTGQPATVASIELAWGDGRPMGTFVDSTSSGAALGKEGLRYRIHMLFDDGFRGTVTQDASVKLEVGERVVVEAGRVVPYVGGSKEPYKTPGAF